ncbi:hypothetical protein B4966_13510 [Rhodocyclaceae bacterium]|nr:hypothetical protein B4966_13510 [Rhodocyclaceae bacterium]
MNAPTSYRYGLRWLAITVALAALGYLGFSLWAGWQGIWRAISTVGVEGILIALVLSLLNYALRFLRWQKFLAALGHPMPAIFSGVIYVAGFALTTTPGKAGELLRAVFLRRHGIPYAHTMAAFVSERLSDSIAILLLAMLGFAIHPHGSVILVIGLLAIRLAIGLLTRAHLLSPWVQRHTGSKPVSSRVLHQLSEVLVKTRQCHTPVLLATATALSLPAWAAESYAFYLILTWMGQQVSLLYACSVYALSLLAGAISFLPGGLGGAEAAMVGLLLLSGVPEVEAIAATLIIRLVTLWFAVALGAIALMLGD